MIINKYEKRLLLSIKIIPIVLLSIVAIIGTVVALYVNKINFDQEINKVKTQYLKNEKQLIKQEVTKVRDSILHEKQLTEKKLKSTIQNYVYNAYASINNIYKENVGKKSNEEIIKMVKDTLREVRFNKNRGYFFIYKSDGTALLVPPNKELEGKNLLDTKDASGDLSIKKMRDMILEKGEAFHTWWWYKPNEKEFQSKKIGFGKYYEPLDLFIGTGEYVEDFEETIQNSIIERLISYSFGRDYYLFIYDKRGKIIVHKDQKKLGKLSYVFQGLQNKTLKEDFENEDSGEGKFYQYSFSKYNTDIEDPTNKISYLLKLKDWDWDIGSGFYTDDLHTIINKTKQDLKKQNDEKIINIIIIFIILMIIVVILSMLLSYVIKKRFESYKIKAKEKTQLLLQQSKMASMGEMIENIAHQWRQPLSIISTTSSGLKVQQEFDMINDKLLSDGLNNISESVTYLSNTIDDFKNFYKDDKQKKSFNLSETINKAIHLLHSRFRKKNIEVIMKDSDIEIFGLQNEMIQVFMNILNNARDVLETLESEKKYIFIDLVKKGENITISFYDNANGIDEKYLPRLFDYKFTTKENQKGTGIGLYMSKLIVEKSGGTIEVQNKEYSYKEKNYKGACFTIIF